MLASLRGGQKQVNWAVDLIQQARQGGRIANVVRSQIEADDLAADKIKTQVQFAPRTPFTLGLMRFLQPVAFAEDF